MKEKLNLPPVLFKFESFNNYSLSNLKNAQIFFNRPVDFNDPFDSSLVLESIEYEDKEVLTLYNDWISNKLPSSPTYLIPSRKKKAKLLRTLPNDLKKRAHEAILEVAKVKQDEWLYHTGCSCFSESKDNLLLWSHYADGHKGFCLEFDTSFDPFKIALKVEYADSFPKMNPIKIMRRENVHRREALIALLTKYSCWKHEKEWRIFHKEARKLYYYEIEALKAVYFGATMENSHRVSIFSILQGKNPNIEFYKAKKSKNKYELKFEKVTHPPLINKKPNLDVR